jgi:predicted dehydrogenase
VAIRLIHVGVGVRGRHWLDVVAQHADFVSAACVDQDEKALQAARECPGQGHGNFFRSLEEALSGVDADAALIASPTALHARHSIQALNAKLAVMVEKPLAVNIAEAVGVVERARAVARPLMVAENYRFFQAERTLRHMLAEQMAGRISSALCIDRRDQPSHTQGVWVKGADHPLLTEIAVHHFDSFRYVFNRQPTSILAKSYNPRGSTYDRQAAADALIELDGKFPVQYSATLVGNRYEYGLWVEGEKGDIWTDRKRVWWRPRRRRFFWPFKLVPVPKGDELPYPKAGTVSLLNQLRDALVQGQVPETSAEDNLWTLAMVEASIVSDREGRQVRIDEVLTPELRRQAGLSSG